jgi:hypothetical protein
MNTNEQQPPGKVIQIPASNGAPLVAAFGLTLSFAGLLTHVMVSILGAITLCAGLIAWFREVLPHEAHNFVTPEREELAAPRPETKVRHLEVGEMGHRARLPLQIYPYSAGVRGGTGWRGGDGRAGHPLRAHWPQEYLVSDQSSCRGRVLANLGDELQPTVGV